MSRFYTYLAPGIDAQQQNMLVCFCTQRFQVDELLDELRRYCDQFTPPDKICLLFPSVLQSDLKAVVSAPRFQSRLPGVSRYVKEPVVELVPFDSSGLFHASRTNIAKIIKEGLVGLFNKHNGLIKGSASFHFTKPSGKHSDGFLRTANVLVRGSEIEFIAACCLAACPKDMTRIYTDTGAIHSVAYAILRLLALFGDSRANCVIDSFGSYSKLSQFPFVDAARALVIISASTSGKLRSEVAAREPRLNDSSILTLFYLGSEAEKQNAICDLTFDPTNFVDGYQKLKSFPADRCPLCSCSTAVRMTEEQFIPQGPQVEPVLIRATDSFPRTSTFFQQFVGQGIFRANYREAGSGYTSSEVYLDLVPLFSGKFLEIESFRNAFDRFASHIISANTKRIIHLNDQASKHFAGQLAIFASKHGLTLDIFPARELIENKVSKQVGGTTIVVASAVCTGRTLTEVSKSLRYLQEGGAIKYAVAFNRPRNQSSAKDTKSHLAYGENGPNEHGFESICEFYFPTVRPERKTAWEIEFDVLNGEQINLAPMLELRREVLRRSKSNQQRGLEDNLFLQTIVGTPLHLRPRFAFWQFDYEDKKISQADVYATIASVLHNLREAKKGSEHSLRQSDHVRKVISPRCFERYNDGIIQASILRASFTSELDYSLRDDLSEDMRSVISSILEQADSSVGEASLEFLLALATQRLQLVPSHLGALHEEYAKESENPYWKYLFSHIGTLLSR